MKYKHNVGEIFFQKKNKKKNTRKCPSNNKQKSIHRQSKPPIQSKPDVKN